MKTLNKRPRPLMRNRNKNRINKLCNHQIVLSPLFILFLVKLDLKSITPAQMLLRLSKHITMLTGNAFFAATNPTVVQLQTLHDDLESAINDIAAGNHALIPHRNTLMHDANVKLHQLSYDIQNQSAGNEEKIKSSGFDVRKVSSASQLPVPVINLRAKAMGNGKIQLRWKSQLNVDMYTIETAGASAPAFPVPPVVPPASGAGSPLGPWTLIKKTTRVSVVIENLNPGQLYYFRVYATNSKGDGNPSDPAEQRCI